jgi:hypothetical protein
MLQTKNTYRNLFIVAGNSFSMDIILGQGSEVQKLTKLFNSLPDIMGMIMIAGTNTYKV